MNPDPIHRIGVLTAGGDCPGLNAVIRAVTKTAIFDHGWEVLGIEDGYLGLIENRIRPLSSDAVSGILTHGGTILGTDNKASPNRFATGRDEQGKVLFSDMTEVCVEHIEQHAIDAIIAIGGDGTMSASQPLAERGVNVIGVPKTIDNDIVGTELTFGFLTAVQICTDALDRVHTTAASHHRVMIVEVMGRNAGWIALYAGIASGADVILLPEMPFDLQAVCDAVRGRSKRGKRYSIICIAEGAHPREGGKVVRSVDPTAVDPIKLGGVGEVLADDIAKETGIPTRCTVLGHVQRGGTPVASDRVLATQFGHHAANLLASGARNRMVAMQDAMVIDVDITVPAGKQRNIPPEHPLIAAARAVGTSFGDETEHCIVR